MISNSFLEGYATYAVFCNNKAIGHSLHGTVLARYIRPTHITHYSAKCFFMA